jgi:hypothetical protein
MIYLIYLRETLQKSIDPCQQLTSELSTHSDAFNFIISKASANSV